MFEISDSVKVIGKEITESIFDSVSLIIKYGGQSCVVGLFVGKFFVEYGGRFN